MAIKNDDFVLLEYTGETGGKVFDTCIEDAAKKGGIHDSERKYQPMLIKVGSGEIIRGLDKALVGMEKGGAKKVTVPAEDGYGKRRAELIKLVPMKVFKQNKVTPMPGMVLNLDNKTARIQSVSGGRVRVDFNHELSGKELVFDIKIVDVLTKVDDIAKALVSQLFGEGKIEVKIDGKKMVARPTPDAVLGKEYLRVKAALITNVLTRLPAVDTIEFVEEYKR